MREMAAIEALKSEKADKEVCNFRSRYGAFADRLTSSGNYNNSQTPLVLLDTKSCVCVTCAVPTFPFLTQIVDLRTTSVVKYVLFYSLESFTRL